MDIEKINVGGTQYDVCDTVARAAVSDEFSTGATYAAGDYCIYENTLYKFTAAKEPGAWDASKVAATQIGDELSQLNGKMGPVTKFYQGSKSWSLGSGDPTDKIGLYTKGQIAELMGISNSFNNNNFIAIVENGDYAANDFVVIGTYFENDVLYVKPDRGVKSNVRFNFLFSYCG